MTRLQTLKPVLLPACFVSHDVDPFNLLEAAHPIPEQPKS